MKNLFTLLSLAAVSMTASANTITWGYFEGTDLSQLNSVGLSAVATYDVAMKLPGAGALGGATIDALKLPVNSKTNMANISVWVADLNMNKIATVEVDKANLVNTAFNEIALAEGVVVPAEGVYVGASFDITKATSNADKYPVYFDAAHADAEEGLLLTVQGEWGDYTSQFGAYAMQVVLSNVDLNDAAAYCLPFENAYTTPGKVYEFPVTIGSDGGVAVQNIEYTINFNGVQETYVADVNIPAGIGKKGSINIQVTGPQEVGAYPLQMAVTKVNGVANSSADKVAETIINNVAVLATRHTVVEEFTGTGCGYCPRGLKGMLLLRENYGDRFVGIGIHQYNSSDPMYNKNYANLGFSGAPSCKIDRGAETDPFYDVFAAFEAANAVIAPVDVELKAIWQEANDYEGTDIKVDLTANVTALADDEYTIEFVLVADSLCGTTSAWKQSNYYYQYSPEPGLEEFCQGGEFGKSSFFWNFDDVMIASSYTNTTNQAEKLGAMVAGDAKESTYTLALPTKATLLNAIKASLDKVYGIAIVCGKNKKVANAMKVRVLTEEEYVGLDNVNAEANVPAVRFSIDGKQVAEGQKGFSVVRMSDGSVRKELRK